MSKMFLSTDTTTETGQTNRGSLPTIPVGEVMDGHNSSASLHDGEILES